MAEGIVEDTVEEFEAHPWLWIGGFVAIAGVIIYLKYAGSSSAAQNFTFSYGPSDAQVAAGTDLAIAQGQQNTALAIANSNNTAQTTEAGDYFGYLTNNSTNSANVALATNNESYNENLYDTNAAYAENINTTNQEAAVAQSNVGYQENLYDTNAAYLTTLARG